MSDSLRYNVALINAKQHYTEIALSARTRATYATGVRTFRNFCLMHNIAPGLLGLPKCPGEDILTYFVCHCANNLRITHATIKSYLAGIKNFYIEHGLGNQFLRLDGQPMLSLELVLRGIKKQCTQIKQQRHPITADVLRKLCQVLDGKIFGTYDDMMMKAACCLAFFGFLRCGEFTTATKSFDFQSNLCLGDVNFSTTTTRNHEFQLLLKASKTDPFREGCVIHYYALTDPICPVKALSGYVASRMRLNSDPNAPLFLHSNGHVLTRKSFLAMLNTVCIQAGMNPSGFTGHSFRIGAATTAAKQKIPEHLVQTLGRWASSCFKLYIKTSKDTIKWAHQTMCKNI